MKEIKDIDLVLDMVKDQDDMKVEGSVMSRSAILIIKGAVIDNVIGKIFTPSRNPIKAIAGGSNEIEENEEIDESDDYTFDDEYEED